MNFEVLRVESPIPELGAQVGDSLVVDLTLPNPVVLRRVLSPASAPGLARAVWAGALVPTSGTRSATLALVAQLSRDGAA